MRQRACYHYISLQQEVTGKDTSGAIKRSWEYIQRNIRCQVQEVGKGDAETIYGIKVANILYVIWIPNPSFEPDATTRYVIRTDPRSLVRPAEIEANIKILEFKGKREPVITRVNRNRELEIHCLWNKQWRL